MHKILLIDDNEGFCKTMEKRISRLGMTADFETSLREGLIAARQENYDIVFLDVNLPDGSGLEIIPKLRAVRFPPEIIIITGHGDRAGAETAIRSGAWDYIEKSTSFQNIRLSLTRAIDYRDQKKTKPTRVELRRDAIVGNSRPIAACLSKVTQAVNSMSPVLVSGETGTGKELFAQAIHENSVRIEGAFIVVDCAALPEPLVESTLFGHKKGAFTGADTDRQGLIGQADGGTLFLDEIGELAPEIQKKFLRVLQEKRFRPVGGKHEIGSNFRLISATHRNLSDMVAAKTFREDLYYRIRSIHIDLPPLRERLEDIPALVLSHLARRTELSGVRFHSMSTDFLETLQVYDWPGNVRELFNAIDHVLAVAIDEPVLFPNHLPDRIRVCAVKKKVTASGTNPTEQSKTLLTEGAELIPMKPYIERMKIHYLKELIRVTGGEIPLACRKSGLSRAYLYQLLNKYGIRAQEQ